MLRRNLVQTQIFRGCAKLSNRSSHTQDTTKDDESNHWTHYRNERSKRNNANTTANIPDAVYQGKARGSRPGGVVLRRPGPAHWHPQIEANKEDDRANSSH